MFYSQKCYVLRNSSHEQHTIQTELPLTTFNFLLIFIILIMYVVISCCQSSTEFDIRRHISWRWNRSNIPGPFSMPIFGASWLYSWIGPYRMKKYHLSNENKFKYYGSVVRENVFFNHSLYHLFDKTDIRLIMNYKSTYPLRPANEADVFYRKSRPNIFNNVGMVNENGPRWEELRNALAPPLLCPQVRKAYSFQMNCIADDLLTCVTNSCGKIGIVSDFRDIVYRAGLETVCSVALDKRMGFLASNIELDTKKIMEAIQGYQFASNEAMYGLPWWKYVPSCLSRASTNLVKYKDQLYSVFGTIIQEVIQDGFSDNPTSILGQLLGHGNIDIKDIKASMVDYITAGVETIGNSIIFVVLAIARDSRIQDRLYTEILAELPSGGKPITLEALTRMPYLKACVQESFRMYPTASQIARITEEDIKVSGGHMIPKHSVVLTHHRIAALQEQNFFRAKEFLPERWLSEGSKWQFSRGLVLPFGAGKRMCPGRRLAEQEIYFMVGKLFQKFRLSLLEDDFELEFNFLLTPAGSPKIYVEER